MLHFIYSQRVDAAQLDGCTISIQEQSIVYQAKVKATTSTSIVQLTYIARKDGSICRKQPRKVDLELPPLEAASWWREDGYDTNEEEEEEDPEHNESDATVSDNDSEDNARASRKSTAGSKRAAARGNDSEDNARGTKKAAARPKRAAARGNDNDDNARGTKKAAARPKRAAVRGNDSDDNARGTKKAVAMRLPRRRSFRQLGKGSHRQLIVSDDDSLPTNPPDPATETVVSERVNNTQVMACNPTDQAVDQAADPIVDPATQAMDCFPSEEESGCDGM